MIDGQGSQKSQFSDRFGADKNTASGSLRLTLVISSLEVGGAQRVMSILANHWANLGWQVTLMTLVDGSRPPSWPLDARITLAPLGVYRPSTSWGWRIANNLRRLGVLRRALAASRPQVVLSFMSRTNTLALAAGIGLPFQVVVAEHTAVGTVRVSWPWSFLRRLLYRRAAAIVVLTASAMEAFPDALRGRITVIPNPVLPAVVKGNATSDPAKIIIAMGSLRPEKGFDLLLRAFAQLDARFLDWQLVILGEGGLRNELEGLANGLGLDGRVSFPGNVADPYYHLAGADLFVLSSRIEGFPMALCEAMACGLPVIAFDCPTGPREIIRHGVDGLLVERENIAALAAALTTLLDDPAARSSFGRRASEISCRFGLEQVSRRWEEILARVISK